MHISLRNYRGLCPLLSIAPLYVNTLIFKDNNLLYIRENRCHYITYQCQTLNKQITTTPSSTTSPVKTIKGQIHKHK